MRCGPIQEITNDLRQLPIFQKRQRPVPGESISDISTFHDKNTSDQPLSSTGIQQNGTVYFIYFFEVLRRFNYLYLKGYITTLSSFQFCRQLYQKIRYRVNIELPRDGFSNENFGSC